MPVADIIREIDAYLSCLRHARNLLSPPETEPRSESARRSKKAKARKSATTVSSRSRVRVNGSRSEDPPPQAKATESSVDSVPQTGSSVVAPMDEPGQSIVERAEVASQSPVEIRALPADEQKLPARPIRRRAAWRTYPTKVEKINPATALTGSMSTKIVVISAEEAKRERDRTASPQVRPRLPGSGTSGKQAFEALFRDEIDSSKASR